MPMNGPSAVRLPGRQPRRRRTVAVVSLVCSEASRISVIWVAWQGKARAQRRRGTFHSGLKRRPDNDDSWKFATTSGKLRKTFQLLWCRGQTD